MLKKRKWPLKGWHKRFFVLENGILKYSKSPIDTQKGKVHGSIDVGLSVMSIKKKARRIDLDTEENIYHLKVKSQDTFDTWVPKLRHHRLFRQNEIVRSPRDASLHMFPSTSTTESSPAANITVSEGKVGNDGTLYNAVVHQNDVDWNDYYNYTLFSSNILIQKVLLGPQFLNHKSTWPQFLTIYPILTTSIIWKLNLLTPLCCSMTCFETAVSIFPLAIALTCSTILWDAHLIVFPTYCSPVTCR
ncbi:hypothetical protein GDO86_008412 [Hymenochirus boettgeri]|uniref:PH domain-containing protein n=1 Tax=Hymenochirus boettgeri TaxID=247094 RepID=A0A8T2J2Q0_9PIPI|nr:hypothetical protein GDO86_008412 [Hymenochirus boettgeri]